MWPLKILTGLTAVGTPAVKAGRFIAKKTPKSVKKFGKTSKKFLKNEIKDMKAFPEMYAGAVITGGALGLGASAAYKGLKKQKLQKNDPRYKALKKKGYV